MATENTTVDTGNSAVNTVTETRVDAPTGPDASTLRYRYNGSGHGGPSGAVWDALVANPGSTATVIATAGGVSKTAGRPVKWTRWQLMDGVRWRVRVGAPWRDVRERYGHWQSVYGLFRCWQRAGIWPLVWAKLMAFA